jgi:preprotein translocase SecF subunit
MKIGNIQIFPPEFFFDFMRWRYFTVGFSAVLSLIAIISILYHGINYSIDFTGGLEMNFTSTEPVDHQQFLKKAQELAAPNPIEIAFLKGKQETYVLRLKETEETTQLIQKIVPELKNTWKSLSLVSQTQVSPKIGQEEEKKGYMALFLACLGILLYIALRFDPRFAPGAVVCLLHDVLIAVGFMTVTNRPFSASSIAAFLTIVGYSINDTVIIYDRIRETQTSYPTMPLRDVVNKSISQTMNRTVLTALTGLLALLVLVLFGGGAIEDFALTMFVGILTGTYSSIYVAAPLTLMMDSVLKRWGWTPKAPQIKVQKTQTTDFAPPIILKPKKK